MDENLPQTVSPGETLAGVQICPFGEYPNGDRAQRCTPETLAAIVSTWRDAGAKEVLCDFEHKSEDPNVYSDTAAAAWVGNLRVDPARGLVGDFKFTETGAKAVIAEEMAKEFCKFKKRVLKFQTIWKEKK